MALVPLYALLAGGGHLPGRPGYEHVCWSPLCHSGAPAGKVVLLGLLLGT